MKEYILHLVTPLFALSVVTCPATELVLPDATITGLSHSFLHGYPGGPATSITDGAARGQYTVSNFTATLTGSETVDWRFEAPLGEMFVIHTPPDGFGNVSLSIFCQWWGGSFDGMAGPVATSFAFEGLIGPEPSHTYSYDIMGTGGKLIQFDETFLLAPETAFTGVEVSAQYDFTTVNAANFQFGPQNLRFQASVQSATQVLGDGTLMTLETIPEPPSVALVILFSLCALFWPQGLIGQRLLTSASRRRRIARFCLSVDHVAGAPDAGRSATVEKCLHR